MPLLPPPTTNPARQPRRLPGESLREHFWSYYATRFTIVSGACIAYTFMAAYLWFAILTSTSLTIFATVATALALAFIAWTVWEWRRVRVSGHNYLLGAHGETRVADLLDDLKRNGYRVLHDQPAPGIGNIDHILIGPAGVFAIETKTRTKKNPNEKVIYDGNTLTIAGHVPDRDPIAQVSAGARFLSNRLREALDKNQFVQPVLVFPDWYVDSKPNAKVWVMNPKQIFARIRSAPERLSREEIARLTDLFTRDATET